MNKLAEKQGTLLSRFSFFFFPCIKRGFCTDIFAISSNAMQNTFFFFFSNRSKIKTFACGYFNRLYLSVPSFEVSILYCRIRLALPVSRCSCNFLRPPCALYFLRANAAFGTARTVFMKNFEATARLSR